MIEDHALADIRSSDDRSDDDLSPCQLRKEFPEEEFVPLPMIEGFQIESLNFLLKLRKQEG